ncbi:MAG: CRTAC1 family protein [Planctomycetota bacterium]
MKSEMEVGLALSLLFLCGIPLSFIGCTGDKTSDGNSLELSCFIEVDDVVGISCDSKLPVLGDRFMPESMAGGCVLFDYDGDGDLDIYRLAFARSSSGSYSSDAGINRLYRQDRPWQFTDVTEESGLGDPAYAMGAAAADIDNDGDLDLYIGNLGPDSIYLNNGDGSFSKLPGGPGIDDDQWSMSILFVDVDRDKDLDIYVTRYLDFDPDFAGTSSGGQPEYPPPARFSGMPDLLLRNDGAGSFTDISAQAGISDLRGRGLGVVADDLNHDGNIDLYVANDGEPNFAWLGDGTGRFTESALTLGLAVNLFGQSEAGMGIATGDVDGDGFSDLLVTHLVHETDTLYRCLQPGQFSDDTSKSGLAVSTVDFTGFGTAFVDADQDGDLDLVTMHGRVLRGAIDPRAAGLDYWKPYGEENHLFINDGTGKFERQQFGFGRANGRVEVSRGLSVGDLDGDGDQDLVFANADGTLRLAKNIGASGSWLLISAILPEHLRHDICAVVEVGAAGKLQRRRVGGGGSYLSSSDSRVHFGLGSVGLVDTLRVYWSDGSVEDFLPSSVNQALVLRKGEGI